MKHYKSLKIETMKKKIEIEINACDNCHRHDMILRTCIGCGITLCSFCGNKIIGGTMEEHNRYKCFNSDYRTFVNFKFDHDIKEMHFCLNCLKNPNKHDIMKLLSACIEKEKLVNSHQESERKYNNELGSMIDKIQSLKYRAEYRLRKKGIELIKPE